MDIYLKKFGSILTSRQAGKEALAAFRPILSGMNPGEEITVDFDGVDVFSPSWGDEFLTPLQNLSEHKLNVKNTSNRSVSGTLGLLEDIHKYKFNTLD